MIQRIQSVYLLLVVVAGITLVFLNPEISPLGGAPVWFSTSGVILAAVLAALSAFAIFLYTNRVKQIQYVVVAQWLVVLFMLLTYGALFYWGSLAAKIQLREGYGAFAALILPLLSFVLLRFAKSGIERDEKKVRSVDRIRD